MSTHQWVLFNKSIFGLVAIYNQFPQDIIDKKSIKEFQTALTEIARRRCRNGDPSWKLSFNAHHHRSHLFEPIDEDWFGFFAQCPCFLIFFRSVHALPSLCRDICARCRCVNYLCGRRVSVCLLFRVSAYLIFFPCKYGFSLFLLDECSFQSLQSSHVWCHVGKKDGINI